MAGSPQQSFIPIDPADAGFLGTRLESVDEIRSAIQARRKPTQKEQAADSETADFRPVQRPPMALLCLLDDGRQDGEWVRLRKEVTILGRSEGDIIIPHDTSMSSRHAAISRQADKGRYRWMLTDLDSTNGTFVRISKTHLKHGQEILLGGRRYRFDAAHPAPDGTKGATPALPPETRAWRSVVPTDLVASLVELTPQGDGQRLLLNQADNWIGRDISQCTVGLVNDLLVSPRHARLYRDGKGVWHLENAGSRNGTWLRMSRIPIETFGQFQIGEQRFLLKIL